MGLFKKTEEEKRQAEIRNIKSQFFKGTIQQNLGQIIKGTVTDIKIDPERNVLVIKEFTFKKNTPEVILPIERVKSFTINDEVSLAKSGNALGGAIVGGLLAGGAGAIIGANSAKGKTNLKWIAVLSYEDKNGNDQEIVFIDVNDSKHKSLNTLCFEGELNKLLVSNTDTITEL